MYSNEDVTFSFYILYWDSLYTIGLSVLLMDSSDCDQTAHMHRHLVSSLGAHAISVIFRCFDSNKYQYFYIIFHL